MRERREGWERRKREKGKDTLSSLLSRIHWQRLFLYFLSPCFSFFSMFLRGEESLPYTIILSSAAPYAVQLSLCNLSWPFIFLLFGLPSLSLLLSLGYLSQNGPVLTFHRISPISAGNSFPLIHSSSLVNFPSHNSNRITQDLVGRWYGWYRRSCISRDWGLIYSSLLSYQLIIKEELKQSRMQHIQWGQIWIGLLSVVIHSILIIVFPFWKRMSLIPILHDIPITSGLPNSLIGER